MFLITRDELDNVVYQVEGHGFNKETATTKFRLFDDDGELCYSGILTDDDDAAAQTYALQWGAYDSGCTTIKVLRDGVWVQDIG